MYSDSKRGVFQLLNTLSDIPTVALHRAEYAPDPAVGGCWMVRLQERDGGATYLCYVARHPLAGDFEEVEA